MRRCKYITRLILFSIYKNLFIFIQNFLILWARLDSPPPHKMVLKVGWPVILLRNLNPPKLCNGTRLLVKPLKTFIIECTILTRCGIEDVLILRIPLIPSDLPFLFKHLQFLVNIYFTMTINKSQGYTLNVAILDLSVEYFSHCQLYIVLSRVTSKEIISIV
jgi:ATP-dependent DNA helicase PIF1